jgi:hypothetical protein
VTFPERLCLVSSVPGMLDRVDRDREAPLSTPVRPREADGFSQGHPARQSCLDHKDLCSCPVSLPGQGELWRPSLQGQTSGDPASVKPAGVDPAWAPAGCPLLPEPCWAQPWGAWLHRSGPGMGRPLILQAGGRPRRENLVPIDRWRSVRSVPTVLTSLTGQAARVCDCLGAQATVSTPPWPWGGCVRSQDKGIGVLSPGWAVCRSRTPGSSRKQPKVASTGSWGPLVAPRGGDTPSPARAPSHGGWAVRGLKGQAEGLRGHGGGHRTAGQEGGP